MQRKIIGVLFCMFLLTISAIPTLGISIPSNYYKDEIEKYSALTDVRNETGKVGFWTFGPHRRIISKISFLNGSKTDLLKIKFILRRNLLPRILPFTNVMVFDSVDFTVEYKRTLLLGNLSPFFYCTTFDDNFSGNMINSTRFFNRKHAVKVEDFTGVIGVFRRFLYMPPHFLIVGTCKNVTLLSSP